MRTTYLALSLGTLAALTAAAGPASAACTRLAFSVNDYGKEGPTDDAKRLLDKYIAKWTSDRGIAKYTTGKKTVTCELFLDVILFDEHTCKAEASVCWDGPPAKALQVKKSTGGEPAAAEAKPADEPQTAKAEKTESGIETGSTQKAAEPIVEEAPVPNDPGDPDPASPNYGGSNPAAN